jgi:hypothetical protein
MADLANKDHSTVVGENIDDSRVENGVDHSTHHDDMSPWQCIKLNPKIAMWTVFTNSSLPLSFHQEILNADFSVLLSWLNPYRI